MGALILFHLLAKRRGSLRRKVVRGFLEYSYFRREKPSVSQTKFIAYGENGFWAYDVAHNIFLKYLIDAAVVSSGSNTDWLSIAIASWRTACLPDFGLKLEANWTSAQRQTFIALASEACAMFAARESIPSEEIISWPILEDLRIFPRGAREVFTAPIVELGRAIIALISRELPDAPEGEIWLYGAPEGRQTIGWKR
jgi:hypothetical protein